MKTHNTHRILLSSTTLLVVGAFVVVGQEAALQPPPEICQPDNPADVLVEEKWEDEGSCRCPAGSTRGTMRQTQHCHNPCPADKGNPSNPCANGSTATKEKNCSCPAPKTNTPDPTAPKQTTPKQAATDDSEYIFRNPLKYDSLGAVLLALINGITLIIMPIIVLAIAYIGFRMVWAGQEKNADYAKWKSAFAWSLAGLFLVLGARGILYVIQNTVKDVLGDEYAQELNIDTILEDVGE